MASYQRIVSITDFKVTKLKENLLKDKRDGKTVNAVFMLKAYYATPEKLHAAPAAPGQPAAAPAPNAAVNPAAASGPAAAPAAK